MHAASPLHCRAEAESAFKVSASLTAPHRLPAARLSSKSCCQQGGCLEVRDQSSQTSLSIALRALDPCSCSSGSPCLLLYLGLLLLFGGLASAPAILRSQRARGPAATSASGLRSLSSPADSSSRTWL